MESEDDDPLWVYREAAQVCVLLSCASCDKFLASGELPAGPRYPDEGWESRLGEAAFQQGWFIDWYKDGYLILCPECAVQFRAAQGPEGATNT